MSYVRCTVYDVRCTCVHSIMYMYRGYVYYVVLDHMRVATVYPFVLFPREYEYDVDYDVVYKYIVHRTRTRTRTRTLSETIQKGTRTSTR